MSGPEGYGKAWSIRITLAENQHQHGCWRKNRYEQNKTRFLYH